MAGTIRITPEELRGAATFLESKLSAMTTEANALKAKIDEISNNWEGAAQTTFIGIFESEMWPVLSDKLPELITGIMGQLNGTAEGLEEADSQIASKLMGK